MTKTTPFTTTTTSTTPFTTPTTTTTTTPTTTAPLIPPLKGVSPYSDISVLFTADLRLQTNPSIIEEMLRNVGIHDLKALLELDLSDFLGIGLDISDADAILSYAR
jgi:hypothetical protein